MRKNLDKALLSGIIFSVFVGISGYSIGMIYGDTPDKKNIKQNAQLQRVAEKQEDTAKNNTSSDKSSSSSQDSSKDSSDKSSKKSNKSTSTSKRNSNTPSKSTSSPASRGTGSGGSSGGGSVSNSKPSIPSKLKDGVYYGQSKGFADIVKVKVTVSNGKIGNIDVVSHNETPGYYEKGASVIGNIVSSQSTSVDSVSGATYTSNAIKNAVADALKSAGGGSSNTGGGASNKGGDENFAQKDASLAEKISKELEEIKKKLLEAQSSSDSKFDLSKAKDGTYEGEGNGFKGKVKVSVGIEKGKISGVNILSHGDDEPYFAKARKITSDVVDKQNVSVGTVSGATFSSQGIKSAIKDALKKAGALSGGDNEDNEILKKQMDALLEKNKELSEEIEDTKDSLEKKITELQKMNEKLMSGTGKNDGKAKPVKLKSGVYQGVGCGYKKRKTTMSVEIKDEKIVKIEPVEYGDDEPFFHNALAMLPKMIAGNTSEVDTITDATKSSRGIKEAVADAIRQAREAGAKEADDKNPDAKKTGDKDQASKKPSDNNSDSKESANKEPSDKESGEKESGLNDMITKLISNKVIINPIDN